MYIEWGEILQNDLTDLSNLSVFPWNVIESHWDHDARFTAVHKMSMDAYVTVVVGVLPSEINKLIGCSNAFKAERIRWYFRLNRVKLNSVMNESLESTLVFG